MIYIIFIEGFFFFNIHPLVEQVFVLMLLICNVCSHTGIGAWEHILQMRVKPYQRMQVWKYLVHYALRVCTVLYTTVTTTAKSKVKKKNFQEKNFKKTPRFCNTEQLLRCLCYTTGVFLDVSFILSNLLAFCMYFCRPSVNAPYNLRREKSITPSL